ncbi:MAG: 16S rRNA (adenine(1518)-N(6)/adenine(1519)-N(6))-dimethyltransferase [Deltaproteobacteria bacterium HGW-Deltaproteobacteria-12]|jgi:16S rRNA (adenine1518-N6/adenine1519-N6)-dimethyltransferase|nr:MAG: 16S rRNA (adenine(1518)-N(6)/adenine(1519)-N(6))-dimethyltransferase [Deltaproteobacteria bacterium HGW-Deltaproteobacteria-12]
MDTPKDIIKNYHVKPRKKLGQSFLLDQNIIGKIVTAAHITPQDVVVEIGAGIGVLTEGLAQNARKLIAVELDKNLVAILQDKLAGRENVEIHSGDIMKFDFNSVSNTYNSKIKVFGNVPYNISSPVIFRLLSFRSVIDGFILMLQKEVVERLVAVPNNKSYGIPSVLLQMFASLEKILDVPATCFYPQPKVESAVIRGTFFEEPAMKLSGEAFFTSLVKAAFAQRRKMLNNNLKNSSLLSDIEEEKIKEALVSAGIDGRRRAETLSVAEFGNLSNLLQDLEKNK